MRSSYFYVTVVVGLIAVSFFIIGIPCYCLGCNIDDPNGCTAFNKINATIINVSAGYQTSCTKCGQWDYNAATKTEICSYDVEYTCYGLTIILRDNAGVLAGVVGDGSSGSSGGSSSNEFKWQSIVIICKIVRNFDDIETALTTAKQYVNNTNKIILIEENDDIKSCLEPSQQLHDIWATGLSFLIIAGIFSGLFIVLCVQYCREIVVKRFEVV